jgi:hypothetical protein
MQNKVAEMRDSLDLIWLAQELEAEHQQLRQRIKVMSKIAILAATFVPISCASSLLTTDWVVVQRIWAISALSIVFIPIVLCAVVVLISQLTERKIRSRAKEWLKAEKLPDTAVSLTGTGSLLQWIPTLIRVILSYVIITQIPNLALAIGLTLVVILLSFLVEDIPNLWARAPLLKGDYELSLQRVLACRRWYRHNKGLISLQAQALMQLDRLAEGEEIARQMIALTQRAKDPYNSARMLSNLGICLGWENRPFEALPLHESAIRIMPSLGMVYENLAGLYLTQGASPQRAVEVSRMAVQFHPEKEGAGRASALAALAWGLAKIGEHDEASVTLDSAFKAADRANIPAFADLNRSAGQAKLALGDRAGAAECFQRASEIDPQGHMGRMAARALAEMQSTSE